MRTTALLAPVLLAALISSGCEKIVEAEDRPPVPVLIGAVVQGADSVFLALGRSRPGEARAAEPGAVLTLSVGGTEVTLREAAGGSCVALPRFTCYTAELPEPLAPGGTVRLRGTLADGTELTAGATAPPVPDIRVEGGAPGDTVRAGSQGGTRPDLDLTRVDGRVATGEVEVDATLWTPDGVIRCPVSPRPAAGIGLPTGEPFLVSLGTTPPRCPGAEVAWDSMAVPVTFLSYDENFTGWWGAGRLIDAEDARWGVEGALGAFGAATPRTFVLIVTP